MPDPSTPHAAPRLDAVLHHLLRSTAPGDVPPADFVSRVLAQLEPLAPSPWIEAAMAAFALLMLGVAALFVAVSQPLWIDATASALRQLLAGPGQGGLAAWLGLAVLAHIGASAALRTRRLA